MPLKSEVNGIYFFNFRYFRFNLHHELLQDEGTVWLFQDRSVFRLYAWPTLDLLDSMRKPMTPRWICATNSVTQAQDWQSVWLSCFFFASSDNSNIKKHQLKTRMEHWFCSNEWTMADLWGQRTIEVFPTPAWHCRWNQVKWKKLSHLDVWIFPRAETCLRCGINKHIAKKVRFAPYKESNCEMLHDLNIVPHLDYKL